MSTLRSGDALPEGMKNSDRPPIPEWGSEDAPEGIRIQKVMAQAGVASRRQAENLISQGRVTVNGSTVIEPGLRINPETDKLTVDGKPVQLDTSKRYLMLNKPVGVVSTMADDRGRPDLSEFTKNFAERLFYVGRLDQDTSGLLILTNDGELAHVLAHPSFGVHKTYIAQVKGVVSAQTVAKLTKGFDLHDGFIQADKARLLSTSATSQSSLVEITLHSGRNRIVRRMLKEVGHPVVDLVRRSFGPLHLGTLGVGEVRELTKVELGDVLALTQEHSLTSDTPALSEKVDT